MRGIYPAFHFHWIFGMGFDAECQLRAAWRDYEGRGNSAFQFAGRFLLLNRDVIPESF